MNYNSSRARISSSALERKLASSALERKLASSAYIQTISKIRGRGQLTVPLEVREALNWSDEEMMVKIVTTSEGFRVEKLPVSHPQHPKKQLTKKEWDKIYDDMEKISRSGKQNIKLTDFLRHDRDTHF